MNKGLKNYTKQLTQAIGGATAHVNINKTDANMHISIPLIQTMGASPFQIGLIYNHHNKDLIDYLFGKGFRLNCYQHIVQQGTQLTVANADGSTDIYQHGERNKETQLLAQIHDLQDDEPTEYTFTDLQGNVSHYEIGLDTYPSRIETKTATYHFSMPDEILEEIHNDKGDSIQITQNADGFVEYFKYYYNNEKISQAKLEYQGSRIVAITISNQTEIVNKLTITYDTYSITLRDEISKQQIVYNFVDERVTSFVEGFDGTSVSERAYSIREQQNLRYLSTPKQGLDIL